MRPSETIDYDADGYDYREYWSGRDYELWAEERALRRLIPRLGTGGWWADFGGAYGRNAVHYLGLADRAVILDYSATNLRNAAARYPEQLASGQLHLVRCDLRAIPFRTGAFDRALVIRVLHHLSDVDECLTEMSRTASGRWLIDVPIKHHVLGLVRGATGGRWRAVRDASPLITGTTDEPFYNFQLGAVRRHLAGLGWRTSIVASVNNFRRWDYVLPKRAVSLARPMVNGLELAAQNIGRGWWGPSQLLLASRAGKPDRLGDQFADRVACPQCKGGLVWTDEAATCQPCGASYPRQGGYWDFVI